MIDVVVPGSSQLFYFGLAGGRQTVKFKYTASTNAKGQTIVKITPKADGGEVLRVATGTARATSTGQQRHAEQRHRDVVRRDHGRYRGTERIDRRRAASRRLVPDLLPGLQLFGDDAQPFLNSGSCANTLNALLTPFC